MYSSPSSPRGTSLPRLVEHQRRRSASTPEPIGYGVVAIVRNGVGIRANVQTLVSVGPYRL